MYEVSGNKSEHDGESHSLCSSMAFDSPPGLSEIAMDSTPSSFCSILTDSNNTGLFRHSDHVQNELKQGSDQNIKYLKYFAMLYFRECTPKS